MTSGVGGPSHLQFEILGSLCPELLFRMDHKLHVEKRGLEQFLDVPDVGYPSRVGFGFPHGFDPITNCIEMEH